ncbi:hypothetical protein E4T43_05398 [Aureobasidium subglaciale]|nr:hypothetical protein E4T43_05398 [Aureobasidium subglaciale]
MQAATLLTDLGRHDRDVRGIVFSPDGQLVAPVSLDGGCISIWETNDGQLQSSTAEHHEMIWNAVFSPDGTQLVSACADGAARSWNVSNGSLRHAVQGEDGEEYGEDVFSPNGELLATGTDIVQIWDTSTAILQHSLIGPNDRNFTPGASLEAMHNILTDQHSINRIRFSSDGNLLVSMSYKTSAIRIWETKTWSIRLALLGYDLSFSPDEKVFVTAGKGLDVRIWDMNTLELRHIIHGSGTVFSPDSETLATMGRDHTILLWNVETGQLMKSLKGYGTAQPSVIFTPASETMITNSGKIIHIWNVATGELQYLLEDHTKKILALALSPNGNILASGSRDHTVRLWDIASGVCLQTLEGHGDEVWGVAFSPDGTRLVTSSDDGIVKLWEIHQP